MTRSFHATRAIAAAWAAWAARWAVGGRPNRFGKARQGADS